MFAAWMLRALTAEHRVTLLTWDAPRLDVVNRHAGTSLASASFEVAFAPSTARRIARWKTIKRGSAPIPS